jgi:hypothetical protein
MSILRNSIPQLNYQDGHSTWMSVLCLFAATHFITEDPDASDMSNFQTYLSKSSDQSEDEIPNTKVCYCMYACQYINIDVVIYSVVSYIVKR